MYYFSEVFCELLHTVPCFHKLVFCADLCPVEAV